jgi:mannose-6-phosphate isomerase
MTVDSITASPLREVAGQAKTWLLEAAAPLWSTVGRTSSGLFCERMTLGCEPDPTYYRTFVQARHVFSFVTIGRLGWGGPWQELVGETTEVILRCARRSDGFFVHRLNRDAKPLDHRADLYDQAFVLLALAMAGAALEREDWFDEAEALLERIECAWKHPSGGFREGEIVDARIRRQNPHMHLLEAFLALAEASRRARFGDAAREIAELAHDRFVDPSSGALLEYFTDELEPAAGFEGQIAEPGLCFEWAWLFERMAVAGWREGAVSSDRLTRFARKWGIDQGRGVALNEVFTSGAVHDHNARLWPQTERLKAAVARYRRLKTEAEIEDLLAAAAGLEKYLEVVTPGLWRDKLKQDGSWVEQAAPGSSLYHISCAYCELMTIKEADINPPRERGVEDVG